jgi:HPr kinase/phosphorylase
MERLPETDLYEDVLGVQIKKMIIPVGGGRNLSVLVEAAVRSAILQMRGIDTIKEFFNRQRMLMEAEE